jgi:hypothetical protein
LRLVSVKRKGWHHLYFNSLFIMLYTFFCCSRTYHIYFPNLCTCWWFFIVTMNFSTVCEKTWSLLSVWSTDWLSAHDSYAYNKLIGWTVVQED